MAKIEIKLDAEDLKKLVAKFFWRYGVPVDDISILVKSKQNYKAVWESADFKAEVVSHKEIDDENV